MRLEFGTRIMHKYALGIPGLLQNEDVARALLFCPATRKRKAKPSPSRSKSP